MRTRRFRGQGSIAGLLGVGAVLKAAGFGWGALLLAFALLRADVGAVPLLADVGTAIIAGALLLDDFLGSGLDGRMSCGRAGFGRASSKS